MAVRIDTDVTAELVALSDIKTHLRISTAATVEDALLNSYLKTARYELQNITKRSLQTMTWKMTLDDFPSSTDAILLPYGPVSSTASDVTITYLDETSGDSTTLAATAYTVDSESLPGRVYPSYNNSWPTPRDVRNAVTITYTAGPATASVDEAAKIWVMMRAGDLYENRETLGPVEMMPVGRLGDGIIDHLLIEVL